MASLALAAMVCVPLADLVARTLFAAGVRGAAPITQHLTLWVCFLGAGLAAREGRLLSLATGQLIPEGRLRDSTRVFSSAVAAAVAALLCVASVDLVLTESGAGTQVTTGLSTWIAQLVLPIAFALISLRLVWRSGKRWWTRALASLGLLAGAAAGLAASIFAEDLLRDHPALLERCLEFRELLAEAPVWPGLVILLAATVLGGPIFALLGGAALLLFLGDGVLPVAVPAETYRLSVSPTLPAIPLFTLVGFLLAEGRASERLLRLFRGLFGWAPGGTAVVCALLCAFVTVFTGGSGVTILALGALLFQALRQDQYGERFSLGLLTASGSLGLLFPPALPLILYGIVAGTPIEDLFVGAVLPGVLLVALIAAWGVREGLRRKVPRSPFTTREALAGVWTAKWELLLPVVALVSIFGGFATLVEAAALTALYAFLVQCFVHRDVSIRADLLRVFRQSLVLLGGVLLILGVALGFTSWMVDAQVPARLLEWVQAQIESPLVFLLGLNVFLLLVGCVMDIFSATVVVVPLLVPLGAAFDIHPVHLGVIFVANLELGYLTPPVGLNLFLASYRFERPLLTVYRAALPMLLILGVGVLVITYVPALTTGLLDLLGR